MVEPWDQPRLTRARMRRFDIPMTAGKVSAAIISTSEVVKMVAAVKASHKAWRAALSTRIARKDIKRESGAVLSAALEMRMTIKAVLYIIVKKEQRQAAPVQGLVTMPNRYGRAPGGNRTPTYIVPKAVTKAPTKLQMGTIMT